MIADKMNTSVMKQWFDEEKRQFTSNFSKLNGSYITTNHAS